MPPRKKAKTSPPQPEKQWTPAKTPTSNDSAAKPEEEEFDPVADPWTDEQETALLKGIIRWKPVGMHKHFRMLAISEYMRSQGYAPSDAEHTRIPGIWKKLRTLYNLQGLDEREDSLVTDTSDETESTKDAYCPFELPDDEFGEMMFERRLAKHPSSSPVAVSSRRGSTVPDTDEPRSSPAAPRGRKAARGGRRSKRSTRLQAEVDARKSNEEEGDSDEETGANEEAEEEGAEAAKGESDGEEEVEEAGSPTTRSTRSHASRSKQPEKATTSTGTRRTGRRR